MNTAINYRQQGFDSYQRKDYSGAVLAFQQAIALNEADHAAHDMLAQIFIRAGKRSDAAVHSMMAVAHGPEIIDYKKRFIEIAAAVPFGKYNETVVNAVQGCFETPEVDCSEAQGIWHSQIAQHPALLPIYKVDKWGGPAVNLKDAMTCTALNTPLFLLGLEKVTVMRKPFENFMTRLRRALLELTPWDDAYTNLACALACYAFNTEYILDVSESEAALVEKLKVTVTQNPDRGSAAVLGCYVPLYTLANADMIGRVLGAGALLELQIAEPQRLAARRKAIPTVTEISAGISADVRAQYEESPYPRWRAAPPARFDAEIRKLLPEKPEILIAGCGTGQEAAAIALALPEAQVTAVDLSLSSLSYAAEQAQRFGMNNITFGHGDILKLGSLNKKFDYISSMGVLHHMHEPMAGWRVLHGLLKDGGLMSIGLYSEAGRKDVVAARKEIARYNFAATPEGIRGFREKISDVLPKKIVEALQFRRDYYSMSMCRDLIFHVQEHRFDIPRIRASLQELDLEFIKFVSPFIPPKGNDLDAWEKHEAENPLIFKNMYKFWCQKAS